MTGAFLPRPKRSGYLAQIYDEIFNVIFIPPCGNSHVSER